MAIDIGISLKRKENPRKLFWQLKKFDHWHYNWRWQKSNQFTALAYSGTSYNEINWFTWQPCYPNLLLLDKAWLWKCRNTNKVGEGWGRENSLLLVIPLIKNSIIGYVFEKENEFSLLNAFFLACPHEKDNMSKRWKAEQFHRFLATWARKQFKYLPLQRLRLSLSAELRIQT
jgi:hypothetical protein